MSVCHGKDGVVRVRSSLRYDARRKPSVMIVSLPSGATSASFAIQSVMMLWMLDRRLGGIGLRESGGAIARMVAASLVMWLACVGVQYLPVYPVGSGKLVWATQLAILMLTGGGVYFGAAAALGLTGQMRMLSKR